MTRRMMACLFAMSGAALGAGCGDGESNPDARLGDGGGSSPGMDGSVAEAGPKRDVAPAIDAKVPDAPLPVDVGAVVDVPLPVDTSIVVDAPAVDAPAGEAGRVVDSLASLEAGRIDAAACTVLPSRFDLDTVLPKGCYLAQRSPIIAASVRLTLSPGVTIIFSAGTELSISGNQVLVAKGTAAEPILLTGLEPSRGYWTGVAFGSTLLPDSVLDYVTIEYAGSTQSDRNGAGIKMTADSRGVRASITNTTVRESQGWGMWLPGTAILGAFVKNTLTENTLGPASVSTEIVSVLDAGSTYKGNDRDELVVMDRAVSKTATWAALDVPYYVNTGVRLAGTSAVPVDWTIAPGTTFIMASEAAIESTEWSAIIAAGTAAKPIRFSGAEPLRGYWQGLTFGSNNTRNVLSNVTVEHAGSTTADRDAAAVKLVADSRGVQVAMSNCVLRQSEGWGLFLTGSAILPGFTGNQLTQNQLGPAKVGSTAAHQLLAQSTYTGNDVDRVWVAAGYITQPVTWSAIGVPYVIDGPLSIRPPDATQMVWTLAPGVQLLMDTDASITVAGDYAVLQAVGTTAAPIVISGLTKAPGSWDSIILDNTRNTPNILDHCLIEFGGGGTAEGHKGMIIAQSDSRGVALALTNSRIENSAVYGLYMGRYAAVDTTGSSFAGNAAGATFQEP